MEIRTANVDAGVRVELHAGGGRWNNLGIFRTLTECLDDLRGKYGHWVNFHFA